MYTIHEDFTGKVFLESFDSLPFQLLGRLERAIAECRSSLHFDPYEYNWNKRIAESLRNDLYSQEEKDTALMVMATSRVTLFTTFKAMGQNARFNMLPILTMLHTELINSDLLVTPFDNIAAAILDALPHGSGINSDWHIVIAPMEHGKGYSVTCKNSYHAMNSAGFYDGWVDFSFSLSLSFDLNNVLSLDLGKDGEIAYSDLTFSPSIAELVEQNEQEYPTSEDDTEFYGVDWEGIDDYLHETIGYCLSELSGK